MLFHLESGQLRRFLCLIRILPGYLLPDPYEGHPTGRRPYLIDCICHLAWEFLYITYCLCSRLCRGSRKMDGWVKTSLYLWALDAMKSPRIKMYAVSHLISSCFPTISLLFFPITTGQIASVVQPCSYSR